MNPGLGVCANAALWAGRRGRDGGRSRQARACPVPQRPCPPRDCPLRSRPPRGDGGGGALSPTRRCLSFFGCSGPGAWHCPVSGQTVTTMAADSLLVQAVSTCPEPPGGRGCFHTQSFEEETGAQRGQVTHRDHRVEGKTGSRTQLALSTSTDSVWPLKWLISGLLPG